MDHYMLAFNMKTRADKALFKAIMFSGISITIKMSTVADGHC